VKLLIWVLIGVVIIAWLVRSKKPLKAPATPPSENKAAGAEAMVQCAWCQVHVPASECVTNPSGAVFCSQEHRRLGEARR
jgi:uncharacterized protein